MTTELVTVVDVIPADPTVLDLAQNPAAAAIALLEQSKLFLAEVQRLDEVIEWKARAGALEEYTKQRDLGHEAELSAAEIVRRCERRIAQLVRDAQERGELLRKTERTHTRNQHTAAGVAVQPEELNSDSEPVPEPKGSPQQFFGSQSARTESYAMADDVPAEKFEEALAEAKQEGNLSRANVIRKIRNEPNSSPQVKMSATQRAERIGDGAARNLTAPQIAAELGVLPGYVRSQARELGIEIPADAVVGKTKAHDSDRIINEMTFALEGCAFSLRLVNFEDLNPDNLEGWVVSLGDSLRSLNRFHKQLKETTHG